MDIEVTGNFLKVCVQFDVQMPIPGPKNLYIHFQFRFTVKYTFSDLKQKCKLYV